MKSNYFYTIFLQSLFQKCQTNYIFCVQVASSYIHGPCDIIDAAILR